MIEAVMPYREGKPIRIRNKGLLNLSIILMSCSGLVLLGFLPVNPVLFNYAFFSGLIACSIELVILRRCFALGYIKVKGSTVMISATENGRALMGWEISEIYDLAFDPSARRLLFVFEDSTYRIKIPEESVHQVAGLVHFLREEMGTAGCTRPGG